MLSKMQYRKLEDSTYEVVKDKLLNISLPGEKWKEIMVAHHSIDYWVSNMGRVFGKDHKILHPYKIGSNELITMYFTQHFAPYRSFRVSRSVSQLVAEAFLPKTQYLDYHKQLFVLHKDGDNTNHRVHNLEWSRSSSGGKKGKSSGPVKVLCVEDNRVFPSIKKAAEAYNVSSLTLRQYIVPSNYDPDKGAYVKHIDKTFKRVEG